MRLPGLKSAARWIVAVMIACMLSIIGWTQDSPQSAPAVPPQAPEPQHFVLKDYAKPRSHFPNPIGPYLSQHVAPPDLRNTPRIEQLLQNGKLRLSMDDAVALALENNLDIAIARYNLNIADTDIMRTKAGANFLGVNSGLVQGTPGGGTGGLSGTVGSGTGGTSAGAGGAGTGTGGLVISTLGSGPQITSFDPILTATLQMDRAFAQSTSIFNPLPIANQNTGTANFSYLQGFKTGTNLSVGFNNTHITTDNPTTTYSPVLTLRVSVQAYPTPAAGLRFRAQ